MTDITEHHKKAKKLFFEQLIILWQEQEWNRNLLSLIERKCNFLPDYHLILFPNGDRQIIDEFELWQDQKMIDILSLKDPLSKVREKIAQAPEVRLMKIVPKNIILKQNARFIFPKHLLFSVKCYSRTCDKIWRYAGDKSDDFNYYTKRSLLLSVYIAARMFYISDDSQDSIKTKEFIASNLESIINIAGSWNKIKLPTIGDIPVLRMFW